MKKFNIYKFISRAVMMTFILLSTIQVLFDMEHLFNIDINNYIFTIVTFTSIIPMILLLLIMNMISRKTKYVSLFVVPEIKSAIKILFYISVFSIFTIWSVLLVTIVGFQFELMLPMGAIPRFLISRIIFSTVYSFVVVMFFNGFSILRIDKRSKPDGVQ